MPPTVALLSDVHGNLPALEAVLDDAAARGATAAVFGGDVASFGAWPEETVEALLAAPFPVTWLRGNWERWLADPSAPDIATHPVVAGAAAFATGRLDAGVVARLGALPTEVVVGTTRWVHAAPGDDMAGIPAEADGDPRAEGGRLGVVREERLVTGHTHVQFVRSVDVGGGRALEVVNPGSVGLPWDGDRRAAYALLQPAGVELRRVGYDHAGATAAVRSIGEPWSDIVAGWLEHARP